MSSFDANIHDEVRHTSINKDWNLVDQSGSVLANLQKDLEGRLYAVCSAVPVVRQVDRCYTYVARQNGVFVGLDTFQNDGQRAVVLEILDVIPCDDIQEWLVQSRVLRL